MSANRRVSGRPFVGFGVTDDDWLCRATDWCWRSIETTRRPSGYWLKFACAFLDAVSDEVAESDSSDTRTWLGRRSNDQLVLAHVVRESVIEQG